jgi:hypothetical protein
MHVPREGDTNRTGGTCIASHARTGRTVNLLIIGLLRTMLRYVSPLSAPSRSSSADDCPVLHLQLVSTGLRLGQAVALPTRLRLRWLATNCPTTARIAHFSADASDPIS